MDNLKRIIGGVAAAMLVATQTLTAVVHGATGLNDPEFNNALSWMNENGLTKYQTVDNYRPYATLTREQAAKFFSEFAKTTLGETPEDSSSCNFSDMDSADYTLTDSIKDSCNLGLFNGSNGEFMPKNPLTKAQAVTVLVRALDGEKAEDVSPWWKNYFQKAREIGLTTETDVMALDREVTRYEVGLMLYRASGESEQTSEDDQGIEDLLGGLLGDGEDTSDEDTTDEDTSDEDSQQSGETDEDTTSEEDTSDEEQSSDVSGNNVEITLNPNTPAAMDVASGVNSFETLTFDIAAGEEDVVINTMELERLGLGAFDAVNAAVVFADGVRLSNAKSFNSSNDIANLNLNPRLVVKAGEVKTVTIKTEVENGGNSFSVRLNSINTDGETNVIMNDSIQSSTFDVKDVAALGVTLTEDDTFSNPDLGEEQAQLFSFEAENTDNNEDVVFNSITFEQDGSVDFGEDIDNVNLYHNGEIVSEGKYTDDYVTFELDDAVTIESSDNTSFEIRADIIGGASETIEFILENELDASFAAADEYNFVSVNGDDITSGNNSLTINAGELTLVDIDPEITTVRQDSDDVVLGTMKLVSNAGTELELEDFSGHIAMNNSGVNKILENIELRDVTNGITYDLTPGNGADTGSGDITENNLGIFFGGSEEITFEIRADIKDNLDNFGDETMTLSINAGGLYISETDDGEKVDDITPSTINFKTIEGSVSDFEINQLPLSNKDSVIGSKNVEVMNFEVSANDSTNLEIRELKVYGSGNGAHITKDHISQLKLYKGSVEEDNLVATETASNLSDGEVTFDDLREEIERNGDQNYYVTVDLVDDDTNADDELNFAVSGYEVRDDDNDEVYLESDDDNSGDLKDQDEEKTSNRIITIKGSGVLSINVDNTDDETDNEKNIVAGTMSDFVASYEFTAQNEGVLIEDLQVVGTGVDRQDFVDSVSEVVLFQDDKTTEIARESVSTTGVSFDDVNYVINEGSENIYVKVMTRPIGKDRAGKTGTYQVTMEVADAEGNNSGKTISKSDIDGEANSNNPTNPSKEFDVNTVGVTIPAIADSVEGNNLKNGGETTVANINISAESTENTNNNGTKLDTLLEEFVFDVDTTNISGTQLTASDFTIEEVGGSTGAIAASGYANGQVTFNLSGSNFGTDNELSTSTTTYEVKVRADVDDPQSDAYLELSMPSGNDAVTFGDDHNGSGFDLYLNKSIDFGEVEYDGSN